jgi:hypothetical protein
MRNKRVRISTIAESIYLRDYQAVYLRSILGNFLMRFCLFVVGWAAVTALASKVAAAPTLVDVVSRL